MEKIKGGDKWRHAFRKETRRRMKVEEKNCRSFFSQLLHRPGKKKTCSTLPLPPFLSHPSSLSFSPFHPRNHHHHRHKFMQALRASLSSGADPNEVEAAGNTPLHSAAYEGWLEGVRALLAAGANPLASNNAGDRPWHWADNMAHDDVAEALLKAGGGEAAEQGLVVVQDHVPKVKEFFSKPCWSHHPKPYKDYIEARRRSDAAMRAAASADGAGLLPGL